MKGQGRIDEFAFVLLAGVILIAMLMIVWTTPLEVTPRLFPASKTITLLPGSSTSFDINITGQQITNVTLSANGFISSWVSFSNNRFDVRSSTLVTVSVAVPSGIAFGSYSGSITVTSTGGSASMPLTVNVQSLSSITFVKRSIALDIFNVSFASGSRALDSQQNVIVSKGLFSENKLSLVGLLDQSDLPNVADARLQIVVSDTNNLGNLIVDFNGQQIYNQPTDIGQLTVPLNVSSLTTSNVVRVSGASPGWMFWATTQYNIRSASLIVDFKGGTSKTVNVNLNQNEAANFDHFTLSSLVIPKPSNAQLEIKVNNQIAYLQTVPLASLSIDFGRDILGNPLIIGQNNTITFSLQSNGEIDFANTILTINSLPSS